ncbi:TraR/DksA family transcriptional regulator [Microbacterium sp. CJ88]|uniref:TraR/DksA family transcriptional regulator n=1 Tax=Microbacterium sp. CJ88 TaxID=3445672 RepID=UPI003F6573FA
MDDVAGGDGGREGVGIGAPEARALLGARRNEITQALAAAGEQLDGIRAARGDADADDEHDPEGPTLSSEWSRVEGLRSDTRAELAELTAAEERLVAGEYGVCTDCGAPIPAARLRIRPATRWCVPCASRRGR